MCSRGTGGNCTLLECNSYVVYVTRITPVVFLSPFNDNLDTCRNVVYLAWTYG